MKLRIKETGEIVKLVGEFKRSDGKPDFTLDSYETLAKLCEAVEDYEEPKVYWYITERGEINFSNIREFNEKDESRKLIGNYFKTMEQAEQAVEKLKALKRLKDKGVYFTRNEAHHHCLWINNWSIEGIEDDLELLFGGEE